MKTFLRNLCKLKTAYSLNIIGLTVAFAAFAIIMMQVRHELSFDKHTQDSDRIFRVEVTALADFYSFLKSGETVPVFSRGCAEMIFDLSPCIESGTVIFPYLDDTYITIGEGDVQKGFKVDFEPCSPDIYKTFHFDMIEGTAESLEHPDQVIIPQSLAIKLFGNQSPIGQVIEAQEYIYQREVYHMTIGGVYKDFENTQLKNSIYVPVVDSDLNNWGNFNYHAYIKLNSPENAEEVVAAYAKYAEEHIDDDFFKATVLNLRPLSDIYFTNDCVYDDRAQHGSLSTTLMLLSIGILIIILATINFTNFSMALVPFRIRSINTKKVLGSTNAALQRGLVVDAIWTTFFSSLISILLVYIIGQSSLRDIASCPIGIAENWDVILGTVLLSILIGIFAGIYPAKYTTSFSPALVLKGSFGLSPRGIRLRKVLVAIQFIISISLISISLLIQKQNSFMQNGDLGFPKENLYLSEIKSTMDSSKYVTMTNKLYELPYVVDVAFGQDRLCSKDNYQITVFQNNGEGLGSTLMYVSWNYLKTIGITPTEGEYPTEADWESPFMYLCANKAFQEKYQVGLDAVFDNGNTKIRCFTDNVKIFSLKKEPEASVLCVAGWGNTSMYSYIYVRVVPGTNPQMAMNEINAIILEPEPTYPVSLQPFTSVLEERFQGDKSFEKAIKAFSILAIIISMIGVFGLILFDTQQRRKEIAVRRVHGADEKEILLMFSKPYMLLLTICFIISVPIVVYIGRTWLDSFANKVSIDLWIFVAALGITLFITLATIVAQVLRAVRNNPVDSIKID